MGSIRIKDGRSIFFLPNVMRQHHMLLCHMSSLFALLALSGLLAYLLY